jgi:uncharacterized SAM-binding protein YcdF (DUF218 family)
MTSICYTLVTVKKLKKYFIVAGGVGFLVFLLYFSLAVYVARQAGQDTKVKSDAIVVLGARSFIDGEYNPCLVSRVKHGVDLYKAHYASKLLFSGGNDLEDGVNEAETMQKIATGLGVSPNDILLEKKSTSTYENFRLSQKILQSNKLHSSIVVTEPFHVARIALVAKKLGFDFSVSPASDSSCWQKNTYFSKYFLKEPLAIILYKLENKL